jgi:hypothetical protein
MRLLLAVSTVAVVLLACATPPAPTPSPSDPAFVPSPTPAAPSDVPSPSASPEPSLTPTEPPVVTPAPSPRPQKPTLNASERYLRDGILRGAVDCAPVRDDLPRRSVGGIECASDDAKVARIGFYLFVNDDDMLEAYFDRMGREGIPANSGDGCWATEGESEYIPSGEDAAGPDRHGCFVNDAGNANYRLTMSGAHVYIGILGRTSDLRSLDAFAFLGNHDTPSYPTLWTPPY